MNPQIVMRMSTTQIHTALDRIERELARAARRPTRAPSRARPADERDAQPQKFNSRGVNAMTDVGIHEVMDMIFRAAESERRESGAQIDVGIGLRNEDRPA